MIILIKINRLNLTIFNIFKGNTMKLIITLLISLALTGCFVHDVQHYSVIDSSNKTVTVSPGSEGLNGKLKQALATAGWSLSVYKGPSISEGEVKNKLKVEQYDTFHTRYRLIANSNQFDLCLNFSPAIAYDVSFIDNKSGSEVFTMSGRGCQPGVVEKFVEAINKTSK